MTMRCRKVPRQVFALAFPRCWDFLREAELALERPFHPEPARQARAREDFSEGFSAHSWGNSLTSWVRSSAQGWPWLGSACSPMPLARADGFAASKAQREAPSRG